MRKLRNAFATLLVTAAAAALAYLAGDALLSGERSLPPERTRTAESGPVSGEESLSAPAPAVAVPETASVSAPEAGREETGTASPGLEATHAPEAGREETEAASAVSAASSGVLSSGGLPSDSAPSSYAFSQLSQEDRLLYEELFSAITGFEEKAVLSVQDADRIERVFTCVLADHPEIFYVDGYTLTTRTLGEEILEVDFQAEYTLSRQETEERTTLVKKAADDILSALTDGMDDYEKLKLLYDRIVTGTEYDRNAPENQTICSVFLYGRSVCQGYAKAFQYLCQRAGIHAVLVTGTVEGGEAHAWTAVRCSGSWYYADPAWGDVDYQADGAQEETGGAAEGSGVEKAAEGSGTREIVDYGYFLVPSRELFRTHTPEVCFPLPECSDMADNYYVREGLYFTDADLEQAGLALETAVREGRESVTFKCADREAYEELYEELLTEQKIFQYLQGGAVSYAVSEEQLALTFFPASAARP
ncbi:MAG TPA: hypothetical protein H9831_08365 [Candidatus Eisenbergiella pullistercoris]|uniref:Transglutaminase-like domain-containing protein n=1 Tax=Candidatus Eisenbergiella pullistercoris TaxID=2838555 RepID=A0A9D1YPR7_9FIRM|nr:hypothetical protein [Candidatus Eisenbergiella pullistercoris]